jgi:hypothetical protein
LVLFQLLLWPLARQKAREISNRKTRGATIFPQEIIGEQSLIDCYIRTTMIFQIGNFPFLAQQCRDLEFRMNAKQNCGCAHQNAKICMSSKQVRERIAMM